MSKCQYTKVYTLRVFDFPIASVRVQYLEHGDGEDTPEDRDSIFLAKKNIEKDEE
jgi:hypothetical protein